jgi:hypothetical protein
VGPASACMRPSSFDRRAERGAAEGDAAARDS